MGQSIRYCTTDDGVRIAYCVEGDEPAMVVIPQLLESFSLHDIFPTFARFMRALEPGRTVVRFDFRGTGLSDRSATELGLTGGYLDLKAVADAAGLNEFALLALTSGGPTAVKYATCHPDRISSLILCGTYASMQDLWSRQFAESYSELAGQRWDMAARIIAGLSGEEAPESMVQHEEILRESMSGETMSRMFMAQWETANVTDLLPLVKAKTLVLHRVEDAAIPFTNGQKLAAGIPSAQLVTLHGRINNPAAGDWEAIVSAIDEFLGGAPRESHEPTAGAGQETVRTILFTDLVGHTDMMMSLGDEKGREVLREHERITREVLKAHSGTEIKTMGDGFMASFGSVTKAVECAVALQRENGKWLMENGGLAVRCGLNAGEPIEEEGDLFGATVIMASRIAAKAEGGEILVSSAVRELCAGKGFVFADRGEFTAKGFEEPARVYEVNWRE
jgi:class 3 adenylate cyclase/alpha-beta hydrolase superfamily lysophospholipase